MVVMDHREWLWDCLKMVIYGTRIPLCNQHMDLCLHI